MERARYEADALTLGLAIRAYYRKRAIALVSAAKKYGDLPKLDGSIPCIDCGGRATIYEHRDYTAPLQVDPTCDPCNVRRGPAPLDPEWVIDHLRYSAKFPLRIRRTSQKGGRPKGS